MPPKTRRDRSDCNNSHLRPLGHLAERCAIYLQPHHVLLGYVCDRYSRCDSAWRESNHLPQTPNPHRCNGSHRIAEICNRKEHCSKGKRGSKNQAHSRKKARHQLAKVEPFAAPSSYLAGDRSGGAADIATGLLAKRRTSIGFCVMDRRIGKRSDAYPQRVETCCCRQVGNRAQLMSLCWVTKRAGRANPP